MFPKPREVDKTGGSGCYVRNDSCGTGGADGYLKKEWLNDKWSRQLTKTIMIDRQTGGAGCYLERDIQLIDRWSKLLDANVPKR